MRARYQALKHALAAQDWRDMNAYARAKSGMIEAFIGWSRRTDPSGPAACARGERLGLMG